MDTFENSIRESVVPKDDKNNNKSKKFFLIITILSVILIVLIILIIYYVSKSSKEDIKSYFGEIKCIYKIESISSEIALLGDEYENFNNSIINLYINETKLNYLTKYNFTQTGIYEIKYILNEKIYMNYMFKNIQNLEKVEMSTNGSYAIVSIKSAFERCLNLNNITISGFNTEQIKSTSKLFFNSGINSINLSNFQINNVEDMSYMFANTKIMDLNLQNLETNNAVNMSYLFSNCKLLKTLNISNF